MAFITPFLATTWNLAFCRCRDRRQSVTDIVDMRNILFPILPRPWCFQLASALRYLTLLSRGRQRGFLHPRIAYWSARIAFLCPCAWPHCNALGKLKKFAPLHELVLLPSSLASGSLHCGSNRRLRIFFWILETGIACLNPLFELLVQRDDALGNWRARKHNYLIKGSKQDRGIFLFSEYFSKCHSENHFLFNPPKK